MENIPTPEDDIKKEQFINAIFLLMITVVDNIKRLTKESSTPDFNTFECIEAILNKEYVDVTDNEKEILFKYVDMLGSRAYDLANNVILIETSLFTMTKILADLIKIDESEERFNLMKNNKFIFQELLNSLSYMLNMSEYLGLDEAKEIAKNTYENSIDEIQKYTKKQTPLAIPGGGALAPALQDMIDTLKDKLKPQDGSPKDYETVMINNSIVKLDKPDKDGWRKLIF